MKVGQKVVCIDSEIRESAKDFHDKYFVNWIKENEIYTIRKVDGGGEAVLLKEVKNPPVYIPALFGKAEPRFNSIRFVPLQTEEQHQETSETIKEIV